MSFETYVHVSLHWLEINVHGECKLCGLVYIIGSFLCVEHFVVEELLHRKLKRWPKRCFLSWISYIYGINSK